MIFIKGTKQLLKMITGCRLHNKSNDEKSVYFGRLLGIGFGMVFQNTDNSFWIKKALDAADWDGKNFSLGIDYLTKALKASKKCIEIDVENNLIIIDGKFSVDAGLTAYHVNKLFPEIEMIHVSDINRKQFLSNLGHVLPLVSIDKDRFILQHIGFAENGQVIYGTCGRRCGRISNGIIRVHNATEKNGAIHSWPLKFAGELFVGYELRYSQSDNHLYNKLEDEYGNMILSNNLYIYPEVNKAFDNNNVKKPGTFIVNVKEILDALNAAKSIVPDNKKINMEFFPDGNIVISVKNQDVITEISTEYKMVFTVNWDNRYYVNVNCFYLIDILKTVSSDFVTLGVDEVISGRLNTSPLYFWEDDVNTEKFLMQLRS
jgi:hypothetical protein